MNIVVTCIDNCEKRELVKSAELTVRGDRDALPREDAGTRTYWPVVSKLLSVPLGLKFSNGITGWSKCLKKGKICPKNRNRAGLEDVEVVMPKILGPGSLILVPVCPSFAYINILGTCAPQSGHTCISWSSRLKSRFCIRGEIMESWQPWCLTCVDGRNWPWACLNNK